ASPFLSSPRIHPDRPPACANRRNRRVAWGCVRKTRFPSNPVWPLARHTQSVLPRHGGRAACACGNRRATTFAQSKTWLPCDSKVIPHPFIGHAKKCDSRGCNRPGGARRIGHDQTGRRTENRMMNHREPQECAEAEFFALLAGWRGHHHRLKLLCTLGF